MIPFGPWTPDTPDFSAGGDAESVEALNVIPKKESLGPYSSLAVYTSALTGRGQGALFARKTDGTGLIVAGDAAKLYRITGTSVTDATRLAGGAYNCAVDARWSFTQFGPFVLAFDGTDNPQVLNVDTDTNFSVLGGSPPIAYYSCVAGDFVMTLQQATVRNRLQWSAINNSASWATSQSTQASQQDIPAGGWGQGLVGLEYGAIVFMESAILRANYEGPPIIFRLSRITDNLGCLIPGFIANYRDLIFFYDQSGFYMMQGGVQITPIGEQRVNTWFRNMFNGVDLGRCTSAIDPVNGVVIFSFPDNSAMNGTPNHHLLYSWTTDRWAHAQPGDHEMIYSAASQQSWTIEQLDAAFGTIEAMPFSWDSSFWNGVARRLVGGFDTTHKLGFYNGTTLAATADTSEAALSGGSLSRVRSVRPMVDGGTPSVSLAVRNRQMDTQTYGSPVIVNALGTCPFNTVGRYVRGRITTRAADSWTHLMGLDDLDVRKEGRF